MRNVTTSYFYPVAVPPVKGRSKPTRGYPEIPSVQMLYWDA